MRTAHIDASHLYLVLVAAKLARHSDTTTEHWCAMSDMPWSTRRCDWRSNARLEHTHRLTPPLFQPLSRGGIRSVIERTRLLHGLAEVRRIWGQGLKSLLNETKTEVIW